MSNVVAVAAGEFHNLALKRDGTVTGWGIPGAHPVSSDGYSNYVAVSVGTLYSLALRANGTVVAWGEGASGETNIPPGLTNVVQIASYYNHNLALVGSPVALSASLRPVITLSGLIGSKVRIEYADQLGNTNLWLTLTNFTLPTSPYLFIDGSGNAYRFYRVVSSP